MILVSTPLLVLAGDPPAAAGGEVEALLGPGHADVEQPALFLEVFRQLLGVEVRQHVFFEPGDDDNGELEALGAVQGHQRDPGFALETVGVADQRDVIEEGGEQVLFD